MMTTAELLGQHLRTLRESAKLTQDQAAEASGIHLRTILKLEAGETNANLSTLEKMATTYSISLAELFSPWAKIKPHNSTGEHQSSPQVYILCKKLKLIFERNREKGEGIKTMIDAVFGSLAKKG